MDTNSTEWRKDAIKEYKARKPQRGAFAVRCKPTGLVWVGASPSLATMQNSVWFGLRHGAYHNKALQSAWNTYGEAAFEYEILEKLSDDVSPLAIKDLLKEQKIQWAGRLGAATLL
jgi:hypothetical protein